MAVFINPYRDEVEHRDRTLSSAIINKGGENLKVVATPTVAYNDRNLRELHRFFTVEHLLPELSFACSRSVPEPRCNW